MFPRSHNSMLQIRDLNEVSLLPESTQQYPEGRVRVASAQRVTLAFVVSFMQMKTQSFLRATIYSTSQACHATFLLPFSSLPLLTEIPTSSKGLLAGSVVNICLLMTGNRQGQLMWKYGGPLWVGSLNTSFWCLCLCRFLHETDPYLSSSISPLGVLAKGTHPLQILTIL